MKRVEEVIEENSVQSFTNSRRRYSINNWKIQSSICPANPYIEVDADFPKGKELHSQIQFKTSVKTVVTYGCEAWNELNRNSKGIQIDVNNYNYDYHQ